MNVKNFTFYGRPDQCQNALIDSVNAQFDPPIAEIEGGMCYMLAMQYLLDYLNIQNAARLPRQIFDILTGGAGQQSYLRQIANNFRAYITNGFNLTGIAQQTQTYIGALSSGRRTAAYLTNFESRSLPTPPLVINNTAIGHLAILFFRDGDGKMCGHAVAAVWDGARYYLYDPNYGVYQADSTDEIYGAVLPTIYDPSGIREFIFSVT